MPTADPPLPFTCTDFVAWVMHDAGTKSTEDFGVSGFNPGLNYVWGNLVVQHSVGSLNSDFRLVQPGDVLQFGDVLAPTLNAQQHNAIVSQNLGGGVFVVVEQNDNRQPFVTVDQLDLSAMTQGTICVYRPEAK
jgi:hypothetical protein